MRSASNFCLMMKPKSKQFLVVSDKTHPTIFREKGTIEKDTLDNTAKAKYNNNV